MKIIPPRFVINRLIKRLCILVILFLPFSIPQAKEKPTQDIVIPTHDQVIQNFNNALIKTNLNQSDELVFILAGQSNMAGYGKRAKLPVAYQHAPANVQFYYNGYPAKMSRFAHFGPEVGFAHAVSRRFPHKKIKIIKFAVGGTSLFAWSPHWQAAKARMTGNASAGPLFKKLIKTVTGHKSLKDSRFTAVLWMQGEADARYPMAARTYAQNLSQFVNALRQALHAPALAFFMGEIDPPIKKFPYREIVRKAQRQASARIRNSRLISTEGLQKHPDNLHYNAAGQLALGLRFAKAFLQTAR